MLVGYDGIVRIADFGIAKLLDSDSPETTAVLKGKYGYMAPEQLRFEGVDVRADLFSLGVTLFEALSSKRLYGGRNVESVVQKIFHEPPPELSDVRGDAPPALERLLLELLAKDREHRVPSAKVLQFRFEALIEDARRDADWTDLQRYLDDELAERRSQETAQRVAAIDAARHRSSIERSNGGVDEGLAAASEVRVGTTANYPRRFARRSVWIAAAATLLTVATSILGARLFSSADEPVDLRATHITAESPTPLGSFRVVPVRDTPPGVARGEDTAAAGSTNPSASMSNAVRTRRRSSDARHRRGRREPSAGTVPRQSQTGLADEFWD